MKGASLIQVFSVLLLSRAADAGVGGGDRPALGWSTWNGLACGITEANIAANVDAMVRLGLVRAGFVGAHIDEKVVFL